jgi:WD40 repeat protein
MAPTQFLRIIHSILPGEVLRSAWKHVFYLGLLWLLFFASGCSGQTIIPTETSTAARTPTSTSTLASSPTLKMTSTMTPLPSVTPAAYPITDFSQIEKRCPHLEEAYHPGFLTNGSVFLYRDLGSPGGGDVMTLTSQDQEPHLTDYPNFNLYGSEDGSWLAYSDPKDVYLLHFLSFDGKRRFSYYLNHQWGGIQAWFPPNQVVFGYGYDQINPARVDIYDILTGNDQVFSPPLDDFYDYDPPVWNLVPDPTLTRFVYARSTAYYVPSLVMVDTKTRQTIWSLARFTPGKSPIPPVWSPDGQWLAVMSWDNFPGEGDAIRWELFTVSREGKAVQWVNVKTDLATIQSTLHANPSVRWSPNGRYLAFYADHLYILDLQMRQIVDLCAPSPQDSFAHPIWSPDSTQIITQQEGAKAFVIDLEKNKIMPISASTALDPFGWLKAP